MKPVSIRAFLLLASCAGVLSAAGPHAEQPQGQQKQAPPTFRVQVEYVEVDAVVRDKSGRFLSDLKREDFEIYEDGKRQDIANVELVDMPVDPEPGAATITGRRFEQDVVNNERRPGRLYLIVLDDLHIDSTHTLAARKLARQFIETNMGPQDLAAVITTSGNRKSTQEFTWNRRLLLEAVDKCVGRKLMAPGMANLLSGGGGGGQALGFGSRGDEAQRVANAQSTLDTLSYLAAFASRIHSRRKAIVLVGEGMAYDLTTPDDVTPAPTSVTAPGDGLPPGITAAPSADVASLKTNGLSRRELRDHLRDFVTEANRGDVTLYALDPTLFTQQGDDYIQLGSLPPGDLDSYGQEIVKGDALQNDLKAGQDNLRTLAAETGGFAVTGSIKAAQGAFTRIRDENSHYYMLGYYPTNEKRDGTFRKIEVRVKRPGAVVKSRKGYVAPTAKKAAEAIETKEGTSPQLREALSSVLPVSGLPINVVASPFRGSAGNGSVLVMLQTPPGAVKFVERNGKIEGEVELSFVAVDDTGKTRGGEHLDLAMPLRPETQAIVDRVGLLVQSRVSLPPGRYVLRVGARDVVGDRIGSVHCDLEIPDFGKLPLSMSGIVISSAETALANPRPDKDLTSMLPGSPAVIRTFPQNDQLGVLVEIYDTKVATPHDIDIVTTVVGEDGHEAYRHEDKRSTAELQGMQGGFGYLLKVPVANMAPGQYLLRVEARSRLDPDTPAARETTFTVMK